MLKIITDNEKTKVVYDDEKKVYIKTFYKNKRLRMCLREYLRLKEYPGINFKKIYDLLSEVPKVNCPEITFYDKYCVITKEIQGKTLGERLQEEKDINKIKKYMNEYVEIVSNIIKEIMRRNIYYNDFHLGNFIIDENDKIYVIDLEGYTKDIFFFIHKKAMLKGVKRIVLLTCYRLNSEGKKIDGEKIWKEIEARI